MDSNGTQFHLFLGYEDWSHCLSEDGHLLAETLKAPATPCELNMSGLAWDSDRFEVTLKPCLFEFQAAKNDRAPKIGDRRGTDRDRFGNWYWIDQTQKRILVNSAGTGTNSEFWSAQTGQGVKKDSAYGEFTAITPPELPEELNLRGLAVTEDHYLVVGRLKPAGLLIFDLFAGGPPTQILWPAKVEFAPFDIAPRKGGGLWILDIDHKRYWALDRNFSVSTMDQSSVELPGGPQPDFLPKEGKPLPPPSMRAFPAGFSLLESSPVTATNPVAIEGLSESEVLILDSPSGPSEIRLLSFGHDLGNLVLNVPFNLAGYDLAFVPDASNTASATSGTLYVVSAEGNQSYGFKISNDTGSLRTQLLNEYFPMRQFGGKALVATQGAVFYDFGEGWVPLIAQRRPRYAREGTLLTPLDAGADSSQGSDNTRHALDGGVPDCVWHRLMIDGSIPPESVMRIWSRAANSEHDLASALWREEPAPYHRGSGSELPYSLGPAGNVDSGTWELLFQNATGRYLQLKIAFVGNGRVTPRIWSLRAYYPRFSYLRQYLPAVYREDVDSASFLDRFLANIEGLFTGLEDRIANVQMQFDVRSALPEALDWLAGWLGIVLDPAWNEKKRRLFIRHAMEFFQQRGTMCGLQKALRLAFDKCNIESIFDPCSLAPTDGYSIRIVEKYRTRRTPGVVLGDPTEVAGPRIATQSARWLPAQGRTALNTLYRKAMQDRFKTAQNLPRTIQFPLTNPRTEKSSIRDQLGAPGKTAAAPEIVALRLLWRDFLMRRYPDIKALPAAYGTNIIDYADVVIPDQLDPAGGPDEDLRDFVLELADGWTQFAGATLGFIPSAATSDEVLWHDFLGRRYVQVGALNDAYKIQTSQGYSSFADVALPDQLPSDGPPLADWFQFEGVVVAMNRAAHRFTVLLPVSSSTGLSDDERQGMIDLATRIVDLEKPAHTVFDVKFYWAFFRAGEARLGIDTLIGQGSRDPRLMPAMVLGRGYLAESYLAPGFPQNAGDRRILGADRLGHVQH